MENNSRKRERLKRLYEFNSYDSDDKINDEPLLYESKKEDIFINNDSIKKKPFKNKIYENSKNKSRLNNQKKKEVVENKSENKSFSLSSFSI